MLRRVATKSDMYGHFRHLSGQVQTYFDNLIRYWTRSDMFGQDEIF